MTSYNRIILAVSVFVSLICKGSTINCFYCNSANNSACLDITQYSSDVLARIVPVVDCQAASQVAMDFFCRKITQTIYHPHREPEVRVTRGCGWKRHEKECYRADNRDHLETVCQCFTDHCNAADTVYPTASVATFLVLAAVLYFYR